MKTRLIITLLLLAAPLADAARAAAPGDLDPGFGGGAGRVVRPLAPGDSPQGVTATPDGKIVVAGMGGSPSQFVVERYRPDGSPDPSFGGDGQVMTQVAFSDGAADAVVQPDGKIVVVGPAFTAPDYDIAVVRYNADGSLDGSFAGGDGIATIGAATVRDLGRAVALGPDGAIVVVGDTSLAAGGYVTTVAVLEPNGTPRTSFAGDGTTVVNSGRPVRDAAVAVQDDGRVVVAIGDDTGSSGQAFVLARLRTDGTPDPSFDGDGVVETPMPGGDGLLSGRSTDVLVQPDGRIVAGGVALTSGGASLHSVLALARYTPNGALDPSFGGDGIETADFGQDAGGAAVGPLRGGGPVVVGTYNPDPNGTGSYVPALAAFRTGGGLDPHFGAAGKVARPLPAGVQFESVEAATVDGDGRIVTVGLEQLRSGTRSAVVSRYLGLPASEPAPSPQPPANGRPDTDMRTVSCSVRAGKLRRFSGTASDSDGIARVEVALVRRGEKPLRWKGARGTTRWVFRLHRRLRKGRYVVYSRAIDSKGIAENAFSRRDRNRYAFRVP